MAADPSVPRGIPRCQGRLTVNRLPFRRLSTKPLSALVAGIAGTTLALYEAKRQEGFARQEAAAKEQARAAEEREREKAKKAANEQTQKRLAQIEKGVGLFAGMLAGINPRSEETEGKPLYDQLRERAEQAVDQLRAEAVADPLAEARLQTVLGITLRELGSHVKAVEVLERARATRERELGADHADTATSKPDEVKKYRELRSKYPEVAPPPRRKR